MKKRGVTIPKKFYNFFMFYEINSLFHKTKNPYYFIRPHVLKVVLAQLKVLASDIQAHQN